MNIKRASKIIFPIIGICLILSSCKGNKPTTEPAPEPTQQTSQPVKPTALPLATDIASAIPNSVTATSIPTNTPSPVPTETAFPTPTVTTTPTLEPTPIPSLTPLPSETPTRTPTPTPVYLQPGLYGAGGCSQIVFTANAVLNWCVVGVTVTQKHNIVVRVSWTTNYPVYKGPENYRSEVYLIDSQGNHYLPFGWGEAAAEFTKILVGKATYGSYTFPPTKPGETRFSLHGYKGTLIEDLILENPSILLLTYTLDNYPLALEYRSDLWEASTTKDGQEGIQHLDMPYCWIQEGNAVDLKGKYKNQIAIGPITYDIYGWLEKDWGVREYVYSSGLEDFESETRPLIMVTIPFADQVKCLNDISEVLSKLFMPEP